ncbi:LacI family DNA-binding transcriptional regulator [Novosphingopyxis iocasae]|uniref:LacI family DNA-binding transcriptional regulator n=1 Tax=Novosphingopyxis iocasae TaxID=2762729 RepID=UPI001651AD39|nr:LacI family DNA-binding transcriptional regulator [Novosphingopyxis iocasae]
MARRRQAVTIKHVAAEAGVSLQTVSRVINHEPNVRPAMKEKVQGAIDKLGYVPSIAAQRMSGSRSYLILALNDRERTIAEWSARQGSDWVGQMLLGGMLKCAEHGYRLIVELIDTRTHHVERELAGAFAALQPDGVLLTPPHSEDPVIIAFLEKQGVPFARIGSRAPGPGIPITMDDEGSARRATQMLVDLGHRRIGFIAGAQEYSLSQRRADGWKDVMRESGLPVDGLLAQGDFSHASGLVGARALLSRDERPTAIIASSDQMALATLDVAKEMGLEVPRALSVISFDNSPAIRYANPSITAVDQPIADTVSRAVELIIAMKRTGEGPEEAIRVSGDLIARESTAPPPPN